MRVAVLQATGLVNSAAENLRRLSSQAREARRRGADLLVTPELFVSGYAPTLVHTKDGTVHREQLAAIAREYAIGLVASTVEHEGGRHYISASFFNAEGTELTRYRKQNLFGSSEKSVFTPGADAPAIVEFHGANVALGICFDVEFPEFVRAAALAGAELLCVPTAVPLRESDSTGAQPFDTRLIPSMVVPTRALESQVYIAYANHAGPHFAGLSTIADPYGRHLSAAAADGELIVANINLNTLSQARRDTDYLSRFAPGTEANTNEGHQ
ncbi:carbon-nitrogen hydrolase [Pseudarthrobacter sulfonivorans]|uniref:Carbon-nitrogen hydrolase n=1 Tax=Pseudarthrobacter sulfonivorans TaxID=121292 RepID=A0A0U3PNA7_9MICC|nr:carbon-nitrogen hydrolase [Pseudarthrobacter sulfonivorans]